MKITVKVICFNFLKSEMVLDAEVSFKAPCKLRKYLLITLLNESLLDNNAIYSNTVCLSRMNSLNNRV